MWPQTPWWVIENVVVKLSLPVKTYLSHSSVQVDKVSINYFNLVQVVYQDFILLEVEKELLQHHQVYDFSGITLLNQQVLWMQIRGPSSRVWPTCCRIAFFRSMSSCWFATDSFWGMIWASLNSSLRHLTVICPDPCYHHAFEEF